MASKTAPHRKFSIEFKLDVLREYYSSNMSKGFICRKYNIERNSLYHWLTDFALEEKSLSLSGKLLEKFMSMQKQKKIHESTQVSISREQELESEIIRLKKALEYSELRNEALSEVLKIGVQDYGIDLLKKAGAKR